MGILEVNNLSHSFGDKDLYLGVSFDLHRGEHMGVVGQNGTGKSTLIKLLLGGMAPNDGTIRWQKNIRIGHIDQYAELDAASTIEAYLRTAFSDLYDMEAKLSALYVEMADHMTDRALRRVSAYQETLERRDFYAIDTAISRVAFGLGLSALGMDRPLSQLSGGQRTKVILAKLLLSKPDVLLLDEPTNFLDVEHIQWLTEYLNAFEGSFAIVSHDFAFLDAITNCIVDIEFQTLRKYHGRYSDFVRQKERLREDYVRQYHAQRREVDKLEAYIAKNKARASTAKMAKSRQKQLDRMDRLAPPSVMPVPRIRFHQMPLSVTRALEIEDLRIGYEQPLLPALNFAVGGGEKVVVRGFNGIGKSTLVKTLVGELPSLGGKYRFSDVAITGYFEQDMRPETRTPMEIFHEEYPGMQPRQIRSEFAHCGVRAEHVLRPVSTLSGGEQNKIKLCRLTMQTCNFLILDEPTNHLDAETKEALGRAIREFAGSVLLVCHEKAFYREWIDRVIDIEEYLK